MQHDDDDFLNLRQIIVGISRSSKCMGVLTKYKGGFLLVGGVHSGTRYEGKEEEENMKLRMSDVWDHDDELLILVSHHDEQSIRRQLDKEANDG